METKRYHLEENEQQMAAEPSPAYAHSTDDTMYMEDECDTMYMDADDGMAADGFSYPGSRSIDEVRDNCMHFEELRRDPSRWCTWEEMQAELHQEFPWLA